MKERDDVTQCKATQVAYTVYLWGAAPSETWIEATFSNRVPCTHPGEKTLEAKTVPSMMRGAIPAEFLKGVQSLVTVYYVYGGNEAARDCVDMSYRGITLREWRYVCNREWKLTSADRYTKEMGPFLPARMLSSAQPNHPSSCFHPRSRQCPASGRPRSP